MSYTENQLRAKDGVVLHASCWSAEQDRRGVVCLVHGIGEHAGRYSNVAEALNQAGFSFLAIDIRGHGKSAGQRGHVDNYVDYMDDIDLLLQEAARRFPGQARFLYGHSMGGNLVANYVLRHEPEVEGVIASAPALKLGFEPPPTKVLLAKIMDRIWPAYSQATGLDTSALSRDPAVETAYLQDPLVHDRISARLFLAILENGAWALEHASELATPMLILQGSDDRLSSPQASRSFAESAGSLCTLMIWDGFYHELHNEPEQDQVFAYVIDWMEKIIVR